MLLFRRRKQEDDATVVGHSNTCEDCGGGAVDATQARIGHFSLIATDFERERRARFYFKKIEKLNCFDATRKKRDACPRSCIMYINLNSSRNCVVLRRRSDASSASRERLKSTTGRNVAPAKAKRPKKTFRVLMILAVRHSIRRGQTVRRFRRDLGTALSFRMFQNTRTTFQFIKKNRNNNGLFVNFIPFPMNIRHLQRTRPTLFQD